MSVSFRVCVSDRQIMGCQKKRQVCVLVLSPLREEDPEKNRERGRGGVVERLASLFKVSCFY